MVVDRQECTLLPTLPKRSPSLMYWFSNLGLSLKTIRHMTDVGMGLLMSLCLGYLPKISIVMLAETDPLKEKLHL